MADPTRKRIAQLIRLLGSSGGERRNAFAALERVMQNGGLTWTDIGNAIEHDSEGDNNKYSETEMQELAQAARAEGVEAGIKIGMTRASNGSSNGHLTLPSPAEMADFCQTQRARLKDDKQREFVDDMVVATRSQMFTRYRLTPGRLGYLASIYIQNGGKT